MANQYCPEYNRTMPEQQEGPEFTPYVNKGSVASKPSASALLAALLTAVIIASIILPLNFSIWNIESRAAELHYAVTEENGFTLGDVVTFRLITSGEEVLEGQLPFKESILLLESLTPDTRYTLEIYRNGEWIKSLNFRTKPEGNGNAPAPSETETALETKPTETTEVTEVTTEPTEETTDPTEITEDTTEPTEETTEPTEETTEPTEVTNPIYYPPANTDPTETDPPWTDPPETDPTETDPPETDPPETDPPGTDPPETDPPSTDPPETDPPATEAP